MTSPRADLRNCLASVNGWSYFCFKLILKISTHQTGSQTQDPSCHHASTRSSCATCKSRPITTEIIPIPDTSADREGIVRRETTSLFLHLDDTAPFWTLDRYVTKQKLLYYLHNRLFEETKGTFWQHVGRSHVFAKCDCTDNLLLIIVPLTKVWAELWRASSSCIPASFPLDVSGFPARSKTKLWVKYTQKHMRSSHHYLCLITVWSIFPLKK